MNSCFCTRPAKRLAALAGLLALCLVAGCYERVTDGNASVYRFAWWLGPAVIAGGILGVPVGWVLRKVLPRWGLALMVLSPFLLILVAPAMYSDRVVVDDEHFEARYGFWFSPTVHNLRFRDLRQIQYVGVPGSRGRTKYELHCVTSAGQATVVSAGDLVRQTVPEILARAKASGVVVVNQVPDDLQL
jgi:hypothetical protein